LIEPYLNEPCGLGRAPLAETFHLHGLSIESLELTRAKFLIM
jgi:hypothetical protein